MLMEKELSPIREISPEEETAASLADVYDQLGTISNRFRSLEEGKRSSDDKIETLSGKIVTQDQKLDAIGRKLELVLQSLPRIETVREFGGTSRDNSSRSQDIRNQVPNSISESCRREVRTGIRENLLKNVEIPVFEGLNIYSWIARVERIFRIGNYNDAEKLELVSVSLDGEALSWFNWEINRRQFQSWIQFKSGLMLRFGNLKIGGPSQSLFCIKQTGSIAEYVQKFEDLSSQVTGLDDQKLEDPFDVDDDSHQGKETISLTESIEEPELIQDTKSVLVTELIEGQKDDQDAEACCVTESFAMELVIAEEAVGKKRGRQQESFCETELIATLEMNNSIQDLESREATYSNLVTDLLHQTKLISHRPVTISDLEQRHPKNLLRFIDMNMVIEHRSLGELDEQFYVFHVKNGDVFYQKTTCVNAKVFAHQLFYILLQRGNNMHQLLKKHKSLKSWRFKFKTRTEEHTLTDQKLLFEDESFVVAAITQEESKLQLKHTWKSKQLQFVQDFKSATSTLWLALLVSTTNQMKSLHTEIFIIQGTGHCIVTKRNDPHLWHCWKKKTGNLLEISVLPMLCLLSFQPSNRKSLLSSLSGPIAEDNETILWSLIHYGDREIDATTELQAVFELILKRYNVWEDCTKMNDKLQLQFRRGKDITTILVVLPVSSPSKIHGVPHALEEE